jgi:hypothetical protein
MLSLAILISHHSHFKFRQHLQTKFDIFVLSDPRAKYFDVGGHVGITPKYRYILKRIRTKDFMCWPLYQMSAMLHSFCGSVANKNPIISCKIQPLESLR